MNSTGNEGSKPSVSYLRIVGIVYPTFFFIIFAFGLFGNVFIFVINSKKNLSHTTMSVYLRVLAIFDTLNLIFNGAVGANANYFPEIFFTNSKVFHSFYCVIIYYLSNCLSLVCGWLIVAMTLDRLIFVTLPMKVKSICTKSKTYFICFILFFITFLFCTYIFYTRGKGYGIIRINKENKYLTSGTCVSNSNSARKFDLEVMPYLTMVLFYIAPSFIILLANVFIIKTVRKASKKRKNISSAYTKNQEKSNQMTKSLIFISSYFPLSTLPFAILYIYSASLLLTGKLTPDMTRTIRITYTINLLSFSNYAMNFYIYLLSGKKFRMEFLKLWKRMSKM